MQAAGNQYYNKSSYNGGYRYFFNGQEMERGSEQSKKRQCLFLL